MKVVEEGRNVWRRVRRKLVLILVGNDFDAILMLG